MKKMLFICLLSVSSTIVGQKKNYLNTEVGMPIPLFDYSEGGYADFGYNYGVEYLHFFKSVGIGLKLNSVTNSINNFTYTKDIKEGLGTNDFESINSVHGNWNHYNIDLVTGAKIKLSDNFDLLFKTIVGVQFSSFPKHSTTITTSENYITQEMTANMSSAFHYGGEFQLAYNVSEKYAFNLSVGTSFSSQYFTGYIRLEDVSNIYYLPYSESIDISVFNICLGYTYKF